MNEVVLSIGSNVSPRRERVAAALVHMCDVLRDTAVSEIYETPEIYGTGRPYMNAVITGKTDMAVDELKALTKRIELQSGRNAAARERGDVPVDIDIVIWNGGVIRPNDYRQTFFKIGAEMVGVLQRCES